MENDIQCKLCVSKEVEKLEPCTPLMGKYNGIDTMENSMRFLKKLRKELPHV